MIRIDPYSPRNADALWAILGPVFASGETYAIDPQITRDAALCYWTKPPRSAFVARDEAQILGSYYICANQSGPGAHVCNCGYATHPAARGRGIASALCEHSLTQARKMGFRAMQFNLVASTNEGAVRLWHKHGFATVGRLPGAFAHPDQGDVDALVMYQRL